MEERYRLSRSVAEHRREGAGSCFQVGLGGDGDLESDAKDLSHVTEPATNQTLGLLGQIRVRNISHTTAYKFHVRRWEIRSHSLSEKPIKERRFRPSANDANDTSVRRDGDV